MGGGGNLYSGTKGHFIPKNSGHNTRTLTSYENKDKTYRTLKFWYRVLLTKQLKSCHDSQWRNAKLLI
jgi:hypothetical protein